MTFMSQAKIKRAVRASIRRDVIDRAQPANIRERLAIIEHLRTAWRSSDKAQTATERFANTPASFL